MTDNNTNDHLKFIDGKWILICPNEVKA